MIDTIYPPHPDLPPMPTLNGRPPSALFRMFFVESEKMPFLNLLDMYFIILVIFSRDLAISNWDLVIYRLCSSTLGPLIPH